jgi:8-oxo-dGTP pyrophosphatase MutT (NUDIX family)
VATRSERGRSAVPENLRYAVERTSVRAVVLDRAGRLLLFHTSDPTMPEVGAWWELPGGGMEPGESTAATAVREIAEETGLVLDEAAVPPPTWLRSVTYVRRHVRVLQHERVVLVRLCQTRPAVLRDGQTQEERETYGEARWWAPAEIEASPERFYPGSLPRLLSTFLSGEPIDEPFEHWN